ncbi:MAG: monovalent cation/H+ antiporter complex subunit F [Acidimicrobiia bacterium]
MNAITSVCFGILSLSAALCVARLLRRGSSLADRIVALDSLLIVVVAGLGVLTARVGANPFVGLIVVAALLGFLGTVTVARYIERRGA